MITVPITLTEIDCCRCGGIFAVNIVWKDERYKRGGPIHCPYCGATLSWDGQTENEKLKKQLAAMQAAHDQTKAALTDERRKLECEVKKYARAKRRVSHGVCPCCKRSFENLRRHMATKHPQFAGEATQ